MSKAAQQTVIYVLVRSALTEPRYRRIWLAARNLRLPRRHWLDELANCLYNSSGEFVYPSGEPYRLPCIDEIFGADLEARWLSYYLEADVTGEFPRRISRKFERVQIIHLYMKVAHPNVARHF